MPFAAVNQQVWLAAVARVGKQITTMLCMDIGATCISFVSLMIFLFVHWVAGLIMMILSIPLAFLPLLIKKDMGGPKGCPYKIGCFSEQEK